MDARTRAQLGAAGEDLATAAQTIGLDRWPRFIGDAERLGVGALSDGAIPGVVKASSAGTDMAGTDMAGTDMAGTDMAVGAIGLGLVLLTLGLTSRGSGLARPTISPTTPTIVPAGKPEDDKAGSAPTVGPPIGAAPDLAPEPGGVVVSDDRRKHILDGEDEGTGGGHGPGRNRPNKTEFPSKWSDNKVIDAIREVANDPESSRRVQGNGRIVVKDNREGVDIEMIVEPNRETVVTGYPINLPQNPQRER